MYCKNCGKQIPDDSKFCMECGASFSTVSQVAPKQSQNIESITITVYSDEQSTINTYQKMGWILKSSQQLYSSVTDNNGNRSLTPNGIKLVFERDKDRRNYNILKEKYDAYVALEREIDKIYNCEIKVPTIMIIISAIIGIIPAIFGIISNIRDLREDYRWGGIDFGDIILFLFLCLLCVGFGICIASLIIIIYIEIRKHRSRKASAPKIAELRSRMSDIANEAERYL